MTVKLFQFLVTVGCLNATKFIVLTDLNKSLLIFNKTYTSPTQTNCAMRCASHGTQCRAFIYFRFNSTCVLGSGFVVTDPPRADVPQLFWVPRIECPTGFTPIELESESLCVKQSNEDFNFREAQSYCVARGSQLYTTKSLDKFNYLPNFAANVWVGLYDSDSNCEFQWSDNNQKLANDLLPILATDYNTSNQCVYFASPSEALVATTCSDTFSVVCEI
ncbi:CD209 antigen-like protein 2 [Biomphalaria pfeifferi]|uniref:CD209 antigen-like protein 2 n=1 Tax=Biomphalaria pfeifferi TaxID=112525 RepID=A0AAD8BSF4_BIOPF|nr:CD209 antigen-like protein 2 [Biomphalaria pfeifferi]